MSGFTALNVEPEDHLEDEVDDTKEIQIEEAFKVYQNALKFHSQGPAFYDLAAEAYRELFASEVFKYPEVLSDFAHEQQDEGTVAVGLPIAEEVPLIAGNTADSAANSLPQLIYLAYKSRAQFELDVARHKLEQQPADAKKLGQYYYDYCLKSFRDAANALERDDTDLDLWKKTARMADVLSSQRLVRYCLESVVAGDDEGDDEAIDLSGLDEAFASGELKKILALVQDDLAQFKPELTKPKSELMRLLQESNDPYSFLPARIDELHYLSENQDPFFFESDQITLQPEEQTMQSLGEALLELVQERVAGEVPIGAVGNVTIDLDESDGEESNEVVMSEVNMGSPVQIETFQKVAEDVKPAKEATESPKSPASFHSAQDEIAPDAGPEKGEEEIADQTEARPSLEKTLHREGNEENLAVLNGVVKPDETQISDGITDVKAEVRLPTRKRSSAAAGMDEPEARTKSKRLRARESLLELAAQEEETTLDVNQYNQEQLRIVEDADDVAFNYLNLLLSKVGTIQFGSPSDLRQLYWNDQTNDLSAVTSPVTSADEMQLSDMQQAFVDWSDEKSSAAMSGHGTRDFIEGSSGLALFLRHLRSAVHSDDEPTTAHDDSNTFNIFASWVNTSSASLDDIAKMWLLFVLSTHGLATGSSSSYLSNHWSADFKELVIDMITIVDEQIYTSLRRDIGVFDLEPNHESTLEIAGVEVISNQIHELIQALFEVHLDILVSLSSPESESDEDEQTQQLLRLEKWAQLATEMVQTSYSADKGLEEANPLLLRYIWASTRYAGHCAGSDKSHILACLTDLKLLLKTAGEPVINLPNNVAMPQISLTAVEQEISRLSTLDFFMSIFDNEASDPLAIILKLEPILEPRSVDAKFYEREDSARTKEKHDELRAFLDSGDASLKLFLWRRLQNAYASISYSPKVVSCLLRAFEIVVGELQTTRHETMESSERQLAMLRWVRDGDELVAKAIKEVRDNPKAFESLDEDHFKSSMAAVISMLRVVYMFVLYDDAVRVGRLVAPTLRPSSSKLFDKSRDRLREAFVRLLTLLFYLLKEATVQFADRFERPADELAEYLRSVHNTLGHRQYCKHCNKLFVKLVKNELLALQSDIDYSYDIAQILYDMYQLKFSPGIGDADHGCIPELLRDKTTAMTLVPLIMTYARRFNPKDLIKSDLRITIDKIQTCLGQVKTSPTLSYNKKSISAYLKSPIDPQQVYRSLKGLGDLMMKPVQGDYANIAASGWYMLLGQMSLAKFKSIKRVNPTSTDDLDTAGTFLRYDLEHNMNNWLGWYRLAQVFDAKIEENLIWNSTKLNESRAEIATLERNAINAYAMAIAVAMRIADDTSESVQQLSDLFCDFAIRLYSSSRPPLNMEAFNTDKHLRHLSSSLDRSMSKVPFVYPFKPYTLWHFAAALLRKRFRTNAKEWLCHYTLGKCLWKMFQSPDNVKAKSPVTIEDVLDAFIEAVETVPKKEKSTEYILEPHYKLVSIIHKLVHRKLLDPSKAVEHLTITQFSRGAQLSEDEHGVLEWEPYILDVLKKLGHADKSNWHHRITARAAHVIYDDEPNIAGALGAKHQFTQQIFTKTMTMQVWKPENERPGRHYVYTGRYLSFFVHLLDQLNDRINMEQLVRRIRRKTTDFLDHPKIWEETALTYVRMLRRAAKVSDGKERAVFDKIAYEEFVKTTEKLEKWTHEEGTTSIYLDVIQDAIELKKLNNSLMKGPAIDDLIGDTYASLYETFVSQSPPEEIESPKPTLPSGTFINMTTESAPTGDDKIDRMRLNNLLSAQIDGSVSAISSALSTPAGIGVQTPSRATPPVEPVRIPTPTKPGRVKTITRREVQRKAEASLNRQAMPKAPAFGRKPIVEIPARADQKPGTDVGDDAEEDDDKDDQANDSRLTSRRPSVADSTKQSDDQEENAADNDEKNDEADDESELSELDDEEVEKETPSTFAKSSSRKRKAEDNEDEDEEEEDDDENDEGLDDANEDDEEGDGDGDQENEDDHAEGENADEEGQDGDEEDNNQDEEEENEGDNEDNPQKLEGDAGTTREQPEVNQAATVAPVPADAMEIEKPAPETQDTPVEIPDSQEPQEPKMGVGKMRTRASRASRRQ